MKSEKILPASLLASSALFRCAQAQLIATDMVDLDLMNGATTTTSGSARATAGSDQATASSLSKGNYTVARGVCSTVHGYAVTGTLGPQYVGISIPCYFFGSFTVAESVALSGAPFVPGGSSVGYVKSYATVNRSTIALQFTAPIGGGNFNYSNSHTYNAQTVVRKFSVSALPSQPNHWSGLVSVNYGTVGAYVKLFEANYYGNLTGASSSQINIIGTSVSPSPGVSL